jgi:hypothetical protein
VVGDGLVGLIDRHVEVEQQRTPPVVAHHALDREERREPRATSRSSWNSAALSTRRTGRGSGAGRSSPVGSAMVVRRAASANSHRHILDIRNA